MWPCSQLVYKMGISDGLYTSLGNLIPKIQRHTEKEVCITWWWWKHFCIDCYVTYRGIILSWLSPVTSHVLVEFVKPAITSRCNEHVSYMRWVPASWRKMVLAPYLNVVIKALILVEIYWKKVHVDPSKMEKNRELCCLPRWRVAAIFHIK